MRRSGVAASFKQSDSFPKSGEDVRQLCAFGDFPVRIVALKYMKRANRPKGRDAKLWGLRLKGYDSPVAGVSILPFNY